MIAKSTGRIQAAPAGRGVFWLASGGVVAWFVVYTLLKPEWVADEQRHFLVIQWFTEGQPLPAGFLPMLPVYHWVAAVVASIFGTSLVTVRAFNTLLAIACLAVVAATIRVRRPDSDGRELLLFAWNPLLFPYLVMAYTETASILALLAALYCHVRGRLLLSAGALLVACLLRQSSIVWVAFFAAWAVIETWQRFPNAARRPWAVLRQAGPRIWGHALLMVAATALFIANPSFSAGMAHANRAAVNVAQYYLFGLVVAILWAPLWIARLRRDWAARLAPALARGVVCAICVGAIGLLAVAFRNPHPWNGDPLYLRNWPLMWMLTSQPARFLVAIVLVLVAVLAAGWVRSRPRPAALALAGLCSILFITPHWLVDPRYYIVPTVFLNLLAGYEPGEVRRLVPWYLALTLALCSYIAVCGSPHGGVL